MPFSPIQVTREIIDGPGPEGRFLQGDALHLLAEMKVVEVRAGLLVTLTSSSVGCRPFTTLKLRTAVLELFRMSQARNRSVCFPVESCGML